MQTCPSSSRAWWCWKLSGPITEEATVNQRWAGISFSDMVVQCLCMAASHEDHRLDPVCFKRDHKVILPNSIFTIHLHHSWKDLHFVSEINKPINSEKNVGCAGCIDLSYVPEASYLVEKEKKCVLYLFHDLNRATRSIPQGIFCGSLNMWIMSKWKAKFHNQVYLVELFRILSCKVSQNL